MAAVTAILAAQQGHLRVGRAGLPADRHCERLVRALCPAAAIGGERLSADEYLALRAATPPSRVRRVARLVMRRGGPWSVYREALCPPAGLPLRPAPGDLVFWDSKVETRTGHALDARSGAELIGFADDSYEILHWTPAGCPP